MPDFVPSDAVNGTGDRPKAQVIGFSAVSVLTIVFTYAIFAALWILLSDRAAAWLFPDPSKFALVSTIKGWLFVAVTSLLLYGMMRRLLGPVAVRRPKTGPLSNLPVVLLAISVITITGVGLSATLANHQDKAVAQLQAIANLKALQVGDWLGERRGDAEFLQTSSFFADQFRRWHVSADQAAEQLLKSRLEQFCQTRNFQSLSLVGPNGKLLWMTGVASNISPHLAPTISAALQDQQIHRIGPYLDVDGKASLDWVVPLTAGRSDQPVIVLHTAPSVWLYPTLRAWPVPSETGEILLLRLENDQALILNQARHSEKPDSSLHAPLPRTGTLSQGATALLRPAPANAGNKAADATKDSLVLYGRDYRGAETVAVMRTVPDTDWVLVAKLDESELYTQASTDAFWVGLSGLLALFIAGAGYYLLRQRHDLAMATQLHESQAAQLRSLRLLDAIAESSTDAIFAKDAQGRYLVLNRETTRILGKTADEVLGQTDAHLFDADFARKIMSEDRRIMQSGFAQTFEEKVPSVAGEQIFLTTKGPLHDASGNVIGLFGISRNVTEREKVAAALRESEQRLLMAQEGAHVGLWDWDLQTNQVYWSPECERLYDLTPGTLRTVEDWRNQLLPEDLAEVDRQTNEAIRNRSTFDVEYRIRLASGGVRWLVSRGRAHCDEHGQIRRMTGVSLDITELKEHRLELEKEVNQRTAELQATTDKLLDTQFAMESVGIGIHWVDAGTGQFLFVNRQAASMLGYTVEEMLLMDYSGIDPSYSQSEFLRFSERLRKSGKSKFDSCEIMRDGLLLPVEVTAYYLPSKGEGPDRIISFVVDITRRKEEELALMQAKEAAEAATKAKSAFLANMSHEIRTPMNAIVGLAHLLRRSAPTLEQAERLNKIGSAAEHLLAILNDVLDLSKIEAGRLELEQVNFPLSAVLDQVSSLVADQAKSKGLNILVDYGNVPTWLLGDPTRLRQALLNYVGNAIKFTDHGRIVLRASIASQTRDDLVVRFEVRDQGIGIAPEKLLRLFHAFEQADASTTRKYGGTGLGLALTQRLAGLMGGEAGADSQPGVGSNFWFTARLGYGQAERPGPTPSLDQASAESELRSRYGAVHLLLVEDDPINQEVALNLLNDAGLKVDVAQDGQKAVELAERTAYDLILMDMQMPVMDGLEATRILRSRPQTATVPILAMTANAFEEDRQRCFAVGMNDIIVKPVEPALMFATLLKWLSPKASSVQTQMPPALPAVPAPAPANEGATQLKTIAGLDLDRGLKSARGNPATLLRRLRQFAELHRHDLADFESRLAKGETEALHLAAHTLKGTAGLLGLTDMQNAAAALDLALRQGDGDLVALAGVVIRAQVALDTNLAALPETVVAPVTGDLARARNILAALRPMLEADDFHAGHNFAENLPILQSSIPGGVASLTLSRLANAMNVFDFQQALSHLGDLEANLGTETSTKATS